MQTPLISVIITTYNHEKYIVQAVESVLAQRECNYELIIGEDCSTDRTRLLIESLLGKSEKIRLLRHDVNLGTQQNLKTCFDCSKGKYIAILEGDDYWIDEYKLKSQYEALEKNPNAVMCFSDINLLFDDGSTTKHFENKQTILPEIITTKEIIINTSPTATFSCCMYTAEVVKKVPDIFFQNKDAFDFLFNLYVLEYCISVFLKKICVNYRQTSQGLWSRKSDREKKNEFIQCMSTYNKLFYYKYDEYFNNTIFRLLAGNEAIIEKTDKFREIFSVKAPWFGKRALKNFLYKITGTNKVVSVIKNLTNRIDQAIIINQIIESKIKNLTNEIFVSIQEKQENNNKVDQALIINQIMMHSSLICEEFSNFTNDLLNVNKEAKKIINYMIGKTIHIGASNVLPLDDDEKATLKNFIKSFYEQKSNYEK
jgi:glycosyltransferase involved in cell wall biosynthesis